MVGFLPGICISDLMQQRQDSTGEKPHAAKEKRQQRKKMVEKGEERRAKDVNTGGKRSLLHCVFSRFI